MDVEARMARKAAAQDRKYAVRYKPKQVGRSVFTIQQVQAKRAEQMKNGRVTKPSRSRVREARMTMLATGHTRQPAWLRIILSWPCRGTSWHARESGCEETP